MQTDVKQRIKPFTAFPNDLFEQIIRSRISGDQKSVLLYVVRNTTVINFNIEMPIEDFGVQQSFFAPPQQPEYFPKSSHLSKIDFDNSAKNLRPHQLF